MKIVTDYLPISSCPPIRLYWISFFAPLRSLRLCVQILPLASPVRPDA
jgi:hypothetical protein